MGWSELTRLLDAGLGFLPLPLHPVSKSQDWPRVQCSVGAWASENGRVFLFVLFVFKKGFVEIS